MNARDVRIDPCISGMAQLLYGGFTFPHGRTTVIAVAGGPNCETSFFGLQLLYRLGLQLGVTPQYCSAMRDVSFSEDLILDMTISSCIRQMTQRYIQNGMSDALRLVDFFFDVDHLSPLIDLQALGIADLKRKADEMLCKGILHYSNRTNALHIRTLKGISDEENLLFRRRYETLNDYFAFGDPAEIERINRSLDRQCGRIDIIPYTCAAQEPDAFGPKVLSAVSAFEPDPTTRDYYGRLLKYMKALREMPVGRSDAQVVILVLDDRKQVPEHLADIVIRMENIVSSDYSIQQLRIDKCDIQGAKLGWHQYKRRDYGIEIYPSLHTYFAKRRYLERALAYTHSNVVTDTFQEYLEHSRRHHHATIRYDHYDAHDRYLEAMFPDDFLEYTPEEVFNMILLDSERNEAVVSDRNADERSSREIRFGGGTGEVTGIIGEPNTFKRFLAYGSMFSTAVRDEHTMIVTLHQEVPVICRQLPCPACIRNRRKRSRCESCLEHIHFMNFNIGCITPSEFIHYFVQQIDVPFRDGKRVRRIILDNLQVVDFCFPLLKQSELFLPALMTVCRERNISLYLLCDKHGELVDAVRTLVDNIICTERTGEKELKLYVERFARYNLSPSKIYCAEIEPVKELFSCREIYHHDDQRTIQFELEPDVIEACPTHTMGDYWNR